MTSLNPGTTGPTADDATAVAEYLRRKSAGGLLSPDPHLPDSEVVTRVARALPRLMRVLDHASKGEDVASAAQDVLDDRDPRFLPTASASSASPGPQPASGPQPLTTPPAVGDVVHVFIEGVDGKVTAADVAANDYEVEFADGSVDNYGLADLGAGSPPTGVTVQPGPHGTTQISGLPTQPATPHNWSVGDRVKWTKDPTKVGSVASLPSGAVVQLGGHTLGNEMGVDLDASAGGGRMVADVDQWEAE